MVSNNSNAALGYWIIKEQETKKLNDNVLGKKALELKKKIQKMLLLQENFAVSAYHLFEDMFYFRLESLNYSIQNNIDLKSIFDIMPAFFEKNKEVQYEIAKIASLDVLQKNALFGIRSLKKVALKVIDLQNENQQIGFQEIAKSSLSKITYLQFENSLKLLPLPQHLSNQLFTMFNSSLMLEISLITADILLSDKENKNVPLWKINEVSKTIAENAQLYGALAFELDILSVEKTDFAILLSQKEEQEIAEWGIDDYAKMLEDE